MKKRLLIIGGAGFIGINSARYFLKKGWKVTILDNLSRGGTEYNLKALQEERLGSLSFIRADIRYDFKKLAAAVRNHDVVLHLAAQVAVTTSIINPREDLEINVLGTFNVLEAVRESKNRPMVLYSSTNKVYGSLPQYPVADLGKRYVFKDKKLRTKGVDEDAAIDFHSPYGCSKGAADQYVIDYGRIYGLKTVVFRQSCIYGEHQMGIEDQGWVAWFAIAALLGKKITIYGSGKQVRDLLYVGDLVQLYDLAIKNIDKIKGEAFNIGGGPKNTLSVNEYLDAIEDMLGLKIRRAKDRVRAGDQPVFVADTRKAKKLLGWSPSISTDKGIKRMIAWIQANLYAIERSLK